MWYARRHGVLKTATPQEAFIMMNVVRLSLNRLEAVEALQLTKVCQVVTRQVVNYSCRTASAATVSLFLG